MAESGVGFLAGGSELPPHQLGVLGSAVSSPSGKIWILEHFVTSEITSERSGSF